MADSKGVGVNKWKSAPGIIQMPSKSEPETATTRPVDPKKGVITRPPPAPVNAPSRNIWEASKPLPPNLVMPQEAANELREEYEPRIEATEQADHEDPLRIDYRNRRLRINRMPPEKKRNRCLSISVSYEEEAILRSYVESTHQSLAVWARDVLFKAIGRRMPKRASDRDEE